jgi:serine/threonine protein kinase
MSTFTCEPGSRLGGRYRLEDRVASSTGWAMWKAIDETLARPVTVLTFTSGFPRVSDTVAAARAASRLTDSRLAQVFDVEEDWDRSYVVMEWVAGDTLTDLLAEGPLDPGHGARMIAQAAEAITVAHAAGVAHLCLTPGSLRWTVGGGVKISGVGIDSALAGVTAEDPALTDTIGLAYLLYAALTGFSPTGNWSGLPPAPITQDGYPRSPRQVRAGIPTGIDDVTCRALYQRDGHGPAIRTPAMFASALKPVLPAPIAPLPAPMVTSRDRPWGAEFPTGDTVPPWSGTGGSATRQSHRSGRGGRPVRTRVAVIAVVVLAAAAVAVGAWSMGHGGGQPGTTGGTHVSHRKTHPPATATVLTPVQAAGFDPLSPPKDDPSNENTDMAYRAIDSNPHTAWKTQFYDNNPVFGGLKKGTGLILDMGKPVRLASVTVTFGHIPGADVQIEVGNSDTRSPATLSTFKTVATGNDLAGTYTFTAHGNATGRYVLIWFTKLPPMAHSANRYMAEVFNVIVRGYG